jgi:hypothetical protein
MIAGPSSGQHMSIVGTMGATNRVWGRFVAEARIVRFLSILYFIPILGPHMTVVQRNVPAILMMFSGSLLLSGNVLRRFELLP